MAAVQTERWSATTAILAGTNKVSPRGGKQWKLEAVINKFSSAPTTSENFVVQLEPKAGSAYNTVLYTLDPSAGSITSIVKTFDDDDAHVYDIGDSVSVAYTNTDGRTFGLQVKHKIL